MGREKLPGSIRDLDPETAARALQYGDTVEQLQGLPGLIESSRGRVFRAAEKSMQNAGRTSMLRSYEEQVLAAASVVRARDRCLAVLARGGFTTAQLVELSRMEPRDVANAVAREEVAARSRR